MQEEEVHIFVVIREYTMISRSQSYFYSTDAKNKTQISKRNQNPESSDYNRRWKEPIYEKKKSWQKRENLGEVDNEVPEIGMQVSLLLKPIGNGFANGFESEGSQLHHWVLWKTPKEPTMESHWNWTHMQTQTIQTSIT